MYLFQKHNLNVFTRFLTSLLIHCLSTLLVKMVFIFSVVLSKVKQRKLILHTEKEQFSIDEITNWLFLTVMLAVLRVTFLTSVGMSSLLS